MNGLNGTDTFDPRIAWREGFESIDAATLLDKPLPKAGFLVDGLIPQGVHLISGSAKIGKSWLMLDLALKLAAGEPFWGMETVKCGVLYLSLEDTLARIQSRLMKLTDEAPSNLRFAVTAGTIGNGLGTEIGSYLHTYPDTKLIIIDTLQKIRSQKNNASGGMYANDYEDISALKQISASSGVSFLLVHHLRKQKDSDVFNQVSGSSGITGAVDTSFVLMKDKRESEMGILVATGRDIEMQQIVLRFENLRWVFVERNDSSEMMREKEPPFLMELVKFMRDKTEWTGTATELIRATGDPIMSPVAVKNAIVEYYNDILKPAGIEFETHRKNSARLITLRKSDAGDAGDDQNEVRHDKAVTPVTAVTDVCESDPTATRGSGLTSTGFVCTNPLVREIPETPGGDENG